MIYLNFTSSHNKVSKNNESNNTADDIGNQRKRKIQLKWHQT